MDSELSNCSSSTIDSIRKAGISRRGGVKVRGGRLPPVQIHNVISKKKIVAPKIPQKRSQVKKEIRDPNHFNELPFKHEVYFREERGRGRERARGRGAKVYIQTEGTLFGDGPAMKIKKERKGLSYERIPRSSKSSGIKMEEKIDPDAIDFLLEFDDPEVEYDTENELKPVKYPSAKEFKREPKQELKLEIKQELKQEMKQEVDFEKPNVSEIMPFIKKEPITPPPSPTKCEGSLTSKFFTPLNNESPTLVNSLIEDMKKAGDEGLLLLLQLPSSFPFSLSSDNNEKQASKKQVPPTSNQKGQEEKLQNKEEGKDVSLLDLPEGFIGKLQFMKSGRVRLMMGSMKIYLEEGSVSDFVSEAVSVQTQGNTGDLAILGKIAHKLILLPQFRCITDNVT